MSGANHHQLDPANAASLRIQQYLAREKNDYRKPFANGKQEEEDPAAKIVPYLAARACHLPQNKYCCSDWIQYILNNHPVLGICCHHKLHPIGRRMRLVALFGSFVFGLAISCIIWMLLTYYDQDPDGMVLEFHVGYNGDESSSSTTTNYTITKGMLALWTVGSGLHSFYDLLVWHFTACACFQAGGCCGSYEACRGCRAFGNYFVILTVVLVTAVAALAVLLRAGWEESSSAMPEDLEASSSSSSLVFGNETITIEWMNLKDDNTTTIDLRTINKDSFGFLLAYAIEVAFAHLYYLITATILFSGVLVCGTLPVLGGRPYELRREQAKKEASNRQAFNWDYP